MGPSLYERAVQWIQPAVHEHYNPIIGDSLPSTPISCFFMYRRRILCTVYGAVDFFIVLSKGLYGWGGGGEQGD
jgi:hypothetical protein